MIDDLILIGDVVNFAIRGDQNSLVAPLDAALGAPGVTVGRRLGFLLGRAAGIRDIA